MRQLHQHTATTTHTVQQVGVVHTSGGYFFLLSHFLQFLGTIRHAFGLSVSEIYKIAAVRNLHSRDRWKGELPLPPSLDPDHSSVFVVYIFHPSSLLIKPPLH